MEKRRNNPILLTLLVLLLIIGLAVLILGASTYVKPRVPFGGPPVILRNDTVREQMFP